MPVIDLSLKISEKMPVYSDDPKPKIRQLHTIKSRGFDEKELTILTHHSTHMDAHSHKFEGGKNLDEEPVEKFFNDALKIDLIGVKKISAKDLEPFEKEIASVKALVLHTGYGKRILDGSAGMDFPFLEKDAGEFLSKFSLNILGIDSMSLDAPTTGAVHKILLPKGVIFLEAMVNLEKAPKRFKLIALPLFVEESDGAPCRAVAEF
ncbi:MAG: cyclase family protein [Candidatus Diapherotrites archaeon]